MGIYSSACPAFLSSLSGNTPSFSLVSPLSSCDPTYGDTGVDMSQVWPIRVLHTLAMVTGSGMGECPSSFTSFCGGSERTGSKPRAASSLHINLPKVGANTETSRAQRWKWATCPEDTYKATYIWASQLQEARTLSNLGVKIL